MILTMLMMIPLGLFILLFDIQPLLRVLWTAFLTLIIFSFSSHFYVFLNWQASYQGYNSSSHFYQTCAKKMLSSPIQAPLMAAVATGPPRDAKFERNATLLEGMKIACFDVGGEPRLCLPEVLNSLLLNFSLQQINNAILDLNIFCARMTNEQLCLLKIDGTLPPSTPSAGLITKSDAERLVATLLHPGTYTRLNPELLDKVAQTAMAMKKSDSPSLDTRPVKVYHQCFGKTVGLYHPYLFISPEAPCIECLECRRLYCPQKFVTHSHGQKENRTCHWGFDSSNWRSYILPVRSHRSAARSAKKLLAQQQLKQQQQQEQQNSKDKDNGSIKDRASSPAQATTKKDLNTVDLERIENGSIRVDGESEKPYHGERISDEEDEDERIVRDMKERFSRNGTTDSLNNAVNINILKRKAMALQSTTVRHKRRLSPPNAPDPHQPSSSLFPLSHPIWRACINSESVRAPPFEFTSLGSQFIHLPPLSPLPLTYDQDLTAIAKNSSGKYFR